MKDVTISLLFSFFYIHFDLMQTTRHTISFIIKVVTNKRTKKNQNALLGITRLYAVFSLVFVITSHLQVPFGRRLNK
jgi:hypothetical protein